MFVFRIIEAPHSLGATRIQDTNFEEMHFNLQLQLTNKITQFLL